MLKKFQKQYDTNPNFVSFFKNNQLKQDKVNLSAKKTNPNTLFQNNKINSVMKSKSVKNVKELKKKQERPKSSNNPFEKQHKKIANIDKMFGDVPSLKKTISEDKINKYLQQNESLINPNIEVYQSTEEGSPRLINTLINDGSLTRRSQSSHSFRMSSARSFSDNLSFLKSKEMDDRFSPRGVKLNLLNRKIQTEIEQMKRSKILTKTKNHRINGHNHSDVSSYFENANNSLDKGGSKSNHEEDKFKFINTNNQLETSSNFANQYDTSINRSMNSQVQPETSEIVVPEHHQDAELEVKINKVDFMKTNTSELEDSAEETPHRMKKQQASYQDPNEVEHNTSIHSRFTNDQTENITQPTRTKVKVNHDSPLVKPKKNAQTISVIMEESVEKSNNQTKNESFNASLKDKVPKKNLNSHQESSNNLLTIKNFTNSNTNSYNIQSIHSLTEVKDELKYTNDTQYNPNLLITSQERIDSHSAEFYKEVENKINKLTYDVPYDQQSSELKAEPQALYHHPLSHTNPKTLKPVLSFNDVINAQISQSPNKKFKRATTAHVIKKSNVDQYLSPRIESNSKSWNIVSLTKMKKDEDIQSIQSNSRLKSCRSLISEDFNKEKKEVDLKLVSNPNARTTYVKKLSRPKSHKVNYQSQITNIVDTKQEKQTEFGLNQIQIYDNETNKKNTQDIIKKNRSISNIINRELINIEKNN